MKILFLTNNLPVTKPLFDWLIYMGKDVVLCEDNINSNFILDNDISFVISYNYAHIIRADVLSLLPHRIINLHISLLPWNRGSSPNIWSFIENTPCGVTIHEVDEGLDTGDILLQEQVYFNYSTETLQSSYLKLHDVVQDLFKANIANILSGNIRPKRQVGEGGFHFKNNLLQYKGIINFNDTINDFVSKLHKLEDITSPPRKKCNIYFFFSYTYRRGVSDE